MLVYLHCNLESPLTPGHTSARGLTSQTLAIAEALDLHVDSSGWAIPAWERAQRKRLSWALYMQDKWTALAHGRPSHIVDENWDVRDLCDADLKKSTTTHSRRTVVNPVQRERCRERRSLCS